MVVSLHRLWKRRKGKSVIVKLFCLTFWSYIAQLFENLARTVDLLQADLVCFKSFSMTQGRGRDWGGGGTCGNSCCPVSQVVNDLIFSLKLFFGFVLAYYGHIHPTAFLCLGNFSNVVNSASLMCVARWISYLSLTLKIL